MTPSQNTIVDTLAVLWLIGCSFLWFGGILFSDSPNFTLGTHNTQILLYASPALAWLGFSVYKNRDSISRISWLGLFVIVLFCVALAYFFSR